MITFLFCHRLVPIKCACFDWLKPVINQGAQNRVQRFDFWNILTEILTSFQKILLTWSADPVCFLSPSCTQSSLSSDWGRPVFEFHLLRWLGNQLKSHNLSGNTSLGSTPAFFSSSVSVERNLKLKLHRNIFSTVILASHSSCSLSPLGVAMRRSQLPIGSFYLF